jgi:hypothetical protein
MSISCFTTSSHSQARTKVYPAMVDTEKAVLQVERILWQSSTNVGIQESNMNFSL